MDEKKDVNTTIRVEPDLLLRLNEEAKNKHMSRSELIRRLIVKGLQVQDENDAWRQQIEADIQAIKEQMPLHGQRGRGPRQRAAS
jgi:metal-responsive CopG/Arc/MetJ family transcriptional regulator